MAYYAVSIDLDTTKMKDDNLKPSEITKIYQKELPEALSKIGFKTKLDGLTFVTDSIRNDSLIPIMVFKDDFIAHAPNTCKYLKKIVVFRIDAWADVTELFRDEKENQTSVD